MAKSFDEVVEFHGHLCLDIAVGYRIARAAMREMGEEASNMKEVVARVENETCAVDAIQEYTGCTMGKRNLLLTGEGKPVYIVMNTRTGKAVRIYSHFWETFDADGEFHARRKKASAPSATPDERRAFQRELKARIHDILKAPEETLFSIRQLTLPAPPKSGKYDAQSCGQCGEQTHVGRLIDLDGKRVCKECFEVASAAAASK